MMPIAHYQSGHYQKAPEPLHHGRSKRSGNHLHVRNGLYLLNLKLGRNDAAKQAFGKIIELAKGPPTSLR